MSEILPNLSPQLIEILNLFGTMAFAVTGAFKAIEHNADLVE
ncbi:MAG: TRIC cation channel family protein [Candidatus Nitrosopolaris sp.]